MLIFILLTKGAAQTLEDVKKELREHVLREAAWAMKELPVTVTSSVCPRSAGGKHDFYSEGDDPKSPGGPYIQRDGMTNPDNFVDHRKAMVRLSRIVGALASAYIISRDDKYVRQAFVHLEAWFADTTTRMNPSLLFAQAISGRVTGRGIGIIDTIHLMEGKNIQQAIECLFPYVEDKSTWPYKQDVMYRENWPVAHPFLVIAATKMMRNEWFETWKNLDHDPQVEEVQRNLPVRNP